MYLQYKASIYYIIIKIHSDIHDNRTRCQHIPKLYLFWHINGIRFV